MSDTPEHVDAVLDAYSGVSDKDADQVLTFSIPLRALRRIALALHADNAGAAERSDFKSDTVRNDGAQGATCANAAPAPLFTAPYDCMINGTVVRAGETRKLTELATPLIDGV